jgi:hypothetical protein
MSSLDGFSVSIGYISVRQIISSPFLKKIQAHPVTADKVGLGCGEASDFVELSPRNPHGDAS